MNKLSVIGLFLTTVVGGLVVSMLLTLGSGEFQITDRAFHCNDPGIGGWLVSIETHRDAGDVISPDWTWDSW